MLTPQLLVDMNEISQAKAVIIIDKINARKTILEKVSSLDPLGERTPLNEALVNSAALLSLLGVSSIAATQWSVEPQQTPAMVESLLLGINEEIYLAAALNKFKVALMPAGDTHTTNPSLHYSP